MRTRVPVVAGGGAQRPWGARGAHLLPRASDRQPYGRERGMVHQGPGVEVTSPATPKRRQQTPVSRSSVLSWPCLIANRSSYPSNASVQSPNHARPGSKSRSPLRGFCSSRGNPGSEPSVAAGCSARAVCFGNSSGIHRGCCVRTPELKGAVATRYRFGYGDRRLFQARQTHPQRFAGNRVGTQSTHACSRRRTQRFHERPGTLVGGRFPERAKTPDTSTL